MCTPLIFSVNVFVLHQNGEGSLIFKASSPFLNLAAPIWDSLLKNSGAALCPNGPDNIVAYRKMLMNMTATAYAAATAAPESHERLPACIVVDSHA